MSKPFERSTFVAAVVALFGVTACGSASSGDSSSSDGTSDTTETPPLPDGQVKIDSGVVEGVKLDGAQAYFGIPYAAPPVGDLRWRPPIAPEAWKKVLSTKEYGPSCPQLDSGLLGKAPPISEDCLTLNVWTPSPAPKKGAPVIVFFHGGGFIWGGAAQAVAPGKGKKLHDGETLARDMGVVVVTANYRLGPMGFLAHSSFLEEDPKYPSAGNYGIEDQRAVLQWVKRNIASFGGDPKNVTLSGQSAGAVSVFVHLTSPKSKGLFHRAVPMSAAATSFLPPLKGKARTEYPLDARVDQGDRFAKAIGCDGAGDVAKCMRGKSAAEVLAALPVREWVFYGPGEVWLPNVDGTTLPKEPYDALLAGEFEHVPTMVGTTKDEGTVFVIKNIGMKEDAYREVIDTQFGDEAGAEILDRYPVTADISPAKALMAGLGDFGMTCHGRRVSRALADGGVDVFRYEFAHPPSFEPAALLGAFHSSDLFFFFDSPWPEKKFTPDEVELSSLMTAYLGRFAETGDPNGDSDPKWPKYDADGDENIELQPQATVEKSLKKDICDFWDEHPL